MFGDIRGLEWFGCVFFAFVWLLGGEWRRAEDGLSIDEEVFEGGFFGVTELLRDAIGFV